MAEHARTRLLLAPALTELEWTIRPELEQWAQVASYDAPGVGAEPPPASWDLAAIVARGVQTIERLRWPDCVVVGDEFGSVTAVHLANALEIPVTGLALGHPCVAIVRDGPRRTLNAEVLHAFGRMLDVDYRAYARAYTQVTKHAYDDDLADRFVARVPHSVALRYKGTWLKESGPLGELIRGAGAPLLLAKHDGCLGWTEGFDDAVAAFPDAATVSCEAKPSACPQFRRRSGRLLLGAGAQRRLIAAEAATTSTVAP